MTDSEYISHLSETFDEDHFDNQANFVFSKTALLEGLSSIEEDSMMIEVSLEEDGDIDGCDLVYLSRKIQSISNILRSSMKNMKLVDMCISSREFFKKLYLSKG